MSAPGAKGASDLPSRGASGLDGVGKLIAAFAAENVDALAVGRERPPAAQAHAIVYGLVQQIFDLEGRLRGNIAALEIYDAQVGPGYGQPTPAMIEAVELVARTEGILLDPVYTGKAMAGLLSREERRLCARRNRGLLAYGRRHWPLRLSRTVQG
ncbi:MULTISPECIES: pyridoxal-phosphate dependent enzyme [unclassified Bosea (in: a-proteobacteria)]|uniref:pyridoxal-phosphate dependent enzyme n=1 Tax=unclassified Bosea (in: a-proteobacteria) TaxID=2653178 RepID=UPI0013E956DD|nr:MULTISPECIES: pyridoxal-phosphate dependent enzyme [unclassified Bosea (in: a-proteobacteria)]